MDTSARVLHILLNLFAGMAAIIIYGQVQFFMAAVGLSQLVEQLDEQLVVFAFSPNPMKATRPEVESPRNPHLAICSRSSQSLLLAFSHPAETHFGVGLKLGLVLEE